VKLGLADWIAEEVLLITEAEGKMYHGICPESHLIKEPKVEKGDFYLGHAPSPTNPKDLVGAKKVNLGALPAAGRILGALAAAYGARKYTPYNWREKKVQYTIYLDAMERHLLALRDGEDRAEDSGISHLGHIIAGASILADAEACGCLIDDRPRGGPAARLLKEHDASTK